MSVLVSLARGIGVVEHTIQAVVVELVDTLLPGTKHRVSGGMRLLPFKGSVVDILVDLQDGVLSHLGVGLDSSGTDSHSKANFKHMTSWGRYFVSKSMHIRSFPGFHDRMALDGQVSLTNGSFGAIV